MSSKPQGGKCILTLKPGHRYITHDGWITPPLCSNGSSEFAVAFNGYERLWHPTGITKGYGNHCTDLIAEYHEPGWVEVRDQLPTEADADERGRVVLRFEDGRAHTARWDVVGSAYSVSHWHPLAKYSLPAPREIEAHGRMYVMKEDK